MSEARRSARPSGLLARFDAAFLAPAPAERLAMLRVIIGSFALAYVIIRSPALASVLRFGPELFAPVGVVSWLARGPLPSPAVLGGIVLCIASGVAFVMGFRHRVAGPVFGFLLLWVISYRNAWGMVFHTENLLVIHVLVLAVTPAADALSWDARRRKPAKDDAAYGWPVRLMSAITVTTYMLAAIAKLQASGIAWVTSDILRNYVAVDNLRKILLGDVHAPLGGWLVQYPALFKPLAAFSLLLELFAPVALLGRRIAKFWVIGVWAFHVGVLATMAIFFPYPLLGIAYLSFFPVERIAARIRERRASTSAVKPAGERA